MSHSENAGNVAQWLARPLCRCYSAVAVRLVASCTSKGEFAGGGTLYWALGSTSDGDAEIFGAWMQPGTSTRAWAGVLSDLEQRGVQRIRVLLSGLAIGEAPISPEGEGAAFPHDQIIAGQSRAVVELLPMPPIRSALGRTVASTADLAEGIQRRLALALGRHGAFVSELEQFTFVSALLKREDRCLYAVPGKRSQRSSMTLATATSVAPC